MMPFTQFRTAAPALEPVTLDEAKAQLRVLHTDDDLYIGALITAAREWAEEWTKRAFIEQTWVTQYQAWPCDGLFVLTRPNLLSVTSVKYRDSDDAEITLDAADYQVEIMAFPGEVKLVSAFSLPDVNEDRLYPIAITFKAGYGAAAASVPAKVRQAILMFVHHLYVNRTPVVAGLIPTKVPLSVEALIGSLKRRNA